MQAIVHDLLALARVNFRGHEFGPVSSASVLSEALSNLGTAVHEAGATVTSGCLPVVHGNQAYLVQVLQNLLANALKFRADRPLQIHVWACRNEQGWTVGVRDNGIGIPQEHSARIFGIFERLHSRARYEGSGIGLALCRKIVELHRGRVWVESEPDRGSTFFFTLLDSEEEMAHVDGSDPHPADRR